jgi:diguanylate cyclase (GGDEF)-like protein
LFLDLDLFKDVNDRFGHLVGDQALKKIAARFASVVREADTIARLGGDEFVIMVTDISGAEDAEIVASKLLETLSEPFHIQGNQIKVNASIGISLFPDNGISAEELLGAADQAMYAVKQHGGGNVSLSDRGLKGSPAGGA